MSKRRKYETPEKFMEVLQNIAKVEIDEDENGPREPSKDFRYFYNNIY